MTQTAVEKDTCSKCGKDVRAEALFCYHCGGNLQNDAKTPSSKAITEPPKTDSDSVRSAAPEVTHPGDEERIAKPAVGLGFEEKSSTPGKQKEEAKLKKDLSKMKSASKLRKRPKPVRRQKVETVWEDSAGSPNIWFILMSIVFTAIAVGLFFLAMQLR